MCMRASLESLCLHSIHSVYKHNNYVNTCWIPTFKCQHKIEKKKNKSHQQNICVLIFFFYFVFKKVQKYTVDQSEILATLSP